MALLLMIGAGASLAAAMYMYSGSLVSYEEAIEKEPNEHARPAGYNPYILNQFQTIKDVIYSANLDENRIYEKPSAVRDGVYGISEHHIKLSPWEPFTVATQKTNLNR